MNKKQSHKADQLYKCYLIANITNYNDDYFLTVDYALRYVKQRFLNEYSWRVKQVGTCKALSDWLAGVALNIDVYNWDILQRAKLFGALSADATETEKDNFLNNYFNMMGNKLDQMLFRTGTRTPKQADYDNFLKTYEEVIA